MMEFKHIFGLISEKMFAVKNKRKELKKVLKVSKSKWMDGG